MTQNSTDNVTIDKLEVNLKNTQVNNGKSEQTDLTYSPAKEALPTEEYQAKLNNALTELEQLDTSSIINYGAKAQEQMTAISDQMLANVKSKDAGPAGEMLSEMIVVLKGFDMKKIDPNKKQSLWDKILFRVKPIEKFRQRYEEVTEQVEAISNSLEKHKETLLHDIKSLDRLYLANLDYFHNLELYIDAGDKKLAILDNEQIPKLAEKASSSDVILDAQDLQDLRATRDDLERRVHDLRLTRQVAMQSLPSIRLVQNNDKGLVTKINSTIINTIPLWRQQLAQAITIYRSNQAAETLKAATDLTNDLLEANAENLNQANQIARHQIERGVFDITSIEKANTLLIKTIEESLQISTEGKKARSEALVKLEKAESDLKETLRKSSVGSAQI